MKKTIIFDLGGVLIDNPSTEMFSHFEKVLGLPHEVLYPAMLKYWKDWESGFILEAELWKNIEKDLGKGFPAIDSLWLNSYLPAYRENKPMFELLESLKAGGHTTALLSNIEHPIKEYILTKNYKNLDAFIFSCEVKMSKPDNEIYEFALKLLETSPENTIFIDDRKENVVAATKLGIHGIQFKDYATLLKNLQDLQIL